MIYVHFSEQLHKTFYKYSLISSRKIKSKIIIRFEWKFLLFCQIPIRRIPLAKVKPIKKQRPSSLPLPVAKLCPMNVKQPEPVRIILGNGIFLTGSLGIFRWCQFSLVDFKNLYVLFKLTSILLHLCDIDLHIFSPVFFLQGLFHTMKFIQKLEYQTGLL